MSIGIYLSIASLACVLPLSACQEDDPKQDDNAVQTDAGGGGNPGHADASVTNTDAGVLVGDLGQARAHAVAGSRSSKR